jgi:hypothetical protein
VSDPRWGFQGRFQYAAGNALLHHEIAIVERLGEIDDRLLANSSRDSSVRFLKRTFSEPPKSTAKYTAIISHLARICNPIS